MKKRSATSSRDPRHARDTALDEELRAHLAMAIADRIARGESPEDAAVAARREFGNIGHIKEVTREMWGGAWLDRLRQDLRYAWRSLRGAPGFTTVAVLTLALGIGANSAVFSIVNGVLLRPLPFRDPDRLVLPSHEPPRGTFIRNPGMDEAHYLEYAKRARGIESIGTFAQLPLTLTGAGEATRLTSASVTPGFFSVLGVRPMMGRTLEAGDEQTGSDVAVISDALWRERLGAAPDIVGHTITLDGVRRTVVGVMPPGFDFPPQVQVWTPAVIRVSRTQSRMRTVVARLAPGVTRDRALAELEAIVKPMPDGAFVQPGTHSVTELLPIRYAIVGDVRQSLYVFAGAVVFVLLIACANVANLLLMRGATRQHEISIRTALGASRGRLVRQLLTESTLIAFFGGALGIGLAFAGVRALVSLAPAGVLPQPDRIHVDGVVLAFTASLCLLTGIGFGLAPALQLSRATLAAAIGETGRAVSGRRGRLRSVLVVGEIALALVLLTGAGLIARSFLRLRSVDLGFQPEHVLTTIANLPPTKYQTPASLHAFRDEVVSRLAHLPGVTAAGAVNWRPLGGALIKGTFTLGDGRQSSSLRMVSKPAVTPGYFNVMGIRVLEGRSFTEQDNASAPGVLIVSASVAKQLWPGKSALGQRVSMEDNPTLADWLTVVGVVDDIVQSELREGRDAAMYQPMAQVKTPFFLNHLSFVVRTSSDPASIGASVRQTIYAVDGDQPLESLGTMTSVVAASIAEPLFHVRLLGIFALSALLLAAIGIYGVLAYAVAERTREIGIRVAIGAVPQDVVRMMIGRTIALAVPGIMLGALASLAVTRVIAGFLFEVRPTDPATFVLVSLLLLFVALAATIVPARRAARVDPLIALRHE